MFRIPRNSTAWTPHAASESGVQQSRNAVDEVRTLHHSLGRRRGLKFMIEDWTLSMVIWLVVSTQLKNISQNGNLPQIGMKIKHVWNHQLVIDGIDQTLKMLLYHKA